MAKRFTDTNKWQKESFGDLSLKMKLVWVYLCDNCDHAGIWDANFKLLGFHLGEYISRELMDEALGDKIVWLSDTKVFIPSFVEFQYGKLNPENRAHLSVINRLEKEGANKVLARPFQGPMDKDKEKDKDKDKGECEGKKVSRAELETAYQSYPLKKGKGKGLAKAKAEIKSQADLTNLNTAISNYRADLSRNQTEAQYIKHFSTFMSEWRDWVDPLAGSSDLKIVSSMPDLSHIKWDDTPDGGAA